MDLQLPPDRRQQVRLGSIFTNDCTSDDPSVKLLKLQMVIGLNQDGDQSSSRHEVDRRVVWCGQNDPERNLLRSVEMTVDFKGILPTLTIFKRTMSSVDSFKFLGTTISWDLKWTSHKDTFSKKAQQRLYFLRQFNPP